MLVYYFKIAWRNLLHNKVFSFINIFGMAAGLACCMLISLYLVYELNYDGYHKNGKDLYLISTVIINQQKEETWASTPAPMGPTMQHDFPEVESSARLLPLLFEDKTLMQYDQPHTTPVSFYATKGFLADSTFFRMFTYHFIEG